jgi:hypothetical protein
MTRASSNLTDRHIVTCSIDMPLGCIKVVLSADKLHDISMLEKIYKRIYFIYDTDVDLVFRWWHLVGCGLYSQRYSSSDQCDYPDL